MTSVTSLSRIYAGLLARHGQGSVPAHGVMYGGCHADHQRKRLVRDRTACLAACPSRAVRELGYAGSHCPGCCYRHPVPTAGSLQVLRRSHDIGLVAHSREQGQAEADPSRVTAAVDALPLDYVSMEPGDALFFHCNLLHRSDQNRSANARWSLICCCASFNCPGPPPLRHIIRLHLFPSPDCHV